MTFTCILCKKSWPSLEDLLNDKELLFNGYQAFPNQPQEGLLIFTHKSENCGTSMAFYVKDFAPLLPEIKDVDVFFPRQDEFCPGYCEDIENLDKCTNTHCRGRVIRDLVQIIKTRVKSI